MNVRKTLEKPAANALPLTKASLSPRHWPDSGGLIAEKERPTPIVEQTLAAVSPVIPAAKRIVSFIDNDELRSLRGAYEQKHRTVAVTINDFLKVAYRRNILTIHLHNHHPRL